MSTAMPMSLLSWTDEAERLKATRSPGWRRTSRVPSAGICLGVQDRRAGVGDRRVDRRAGVGPAGAELPRQVPGGAVAKQLGGEEIPEVAEFGRGVELEVAGGPDVPHALDGRVGDDVEALELDARGQLAIVSSSASGP